MTVTTPHWKIIWLSAGLGLLCPTYVSNLNPNASALQTMLAVSSKACPCRPMPQSVPTRRGSSSPSNTWYHAQLHQCMKTRTENGANFGRAIPETGSRFHSADRYALSSQYYTLHYRKQHNKIRYECNLAATKEQLTHCIVPGAPSPNPWPWQMTLTFNPRWSMVLTHIHAKIKVKGQSIQKLLWKQTEERTDGLDRLHCHVRQLGR